MITREQCMQWAEEAASEKKREDWNEVAFVLGEEAIEALCQRVWNEAIEAAAKKCDEWYEDRGLYGVDALAKDVRKMKDVK